MAREAKKENNQASKGMDCLKFSFIIELMLAIWLLLSVGLLLVERHFLFKLVCKEWPEDILCYTTETVLAKI